MNYDKLFQESDFLAGGENMSCLYYRLRGDTPLQSPCRYPMLFVLQGSLELNFKYSFCVVEAGNVVVVDPQAMLRYCPSASTVVLVYHTPRRLEDFFGQCSRSFDASFSQLVPILPPLRIWIDTLLEQSALGQYPTGEAAHKQRKELARIFLTYSRRTLGELYAAFSVCAFGNCETCHQGVLDTPVKKQSDDLQIELTSRIG